MFGFKETSTLYDLTNTYFEGSGAANKFGKRGHSKEKRTDCPLVTLGLYFLYDRKLLAKLSKCAWNVITAYLKSIVPDGDAVPGASIAVQTYGDFHNFNPHLHAIVSDGCFLKDGSFQTASLITLINSSEVS